MFVVSDRRLRALSLRSRFMATPAGPRDTSEHTEPLPPPRSTVAIAGLALLVLLLVLSVVPGVGGLIFLFYDEGQMTSCPAPGGCGPVLSVTAGRVESRGLLRGVGSSGLEDQVYVSIERSGDEPVVVVLTHVTGAQAGSARRSERGPAWVTLLDPAGEIDRLTAVFGPAGGRSPLTLVGAQHVQAVDVETLHAPVVALTGPLSQFPAGVHAVIVAGAVWLGWRRSGPAKVAVIVRYALATAAGVVVAAGLRDAIYRAVGKAFGVESYPFAVGVATVVLFALLVVAAPITAYLATRRTVSAAFHFFESVRFVGDLLVLRALSGIVAAAVALVCLQLADQVLGAVFFGWSF